MDFLNWLQENSSQSVELAYELWRNLCHSSMSQIPVLAKLNEVYEAFVKLEDDFSKSFEQLDLETLKNTLSHSCNLPKSIQSYSVPTTFSSLKRFWSFCSDYLLMNLIECHGTDEDKANAACYSQLFEHTISIIGITQLPRNVYGSLCLTTDAEKKNKLKIDVRGDIELLKVAQVQYVHSEFAKKFNVHPCLMHFYDITQNNKMCSLDFFVPEWIYEELLNVPNDLDDKIVEELHVMGYGFGDYPYYVVSKCNTESLHDSN